MMTSLLMFKSLKLKSWARRATCATFVGITPQQSPKDLQTPGKELLTIWGLFIKRQKMCLVPFVTNNSKIVKVFGIIPTENMELDYPDRDLENKKTFLIFVCSEWVFLVMD